MNVKLTPPILQLIAFTNVDGSINTLTGKAYGADTDFCHFLSRSLERSLVPLVVDDCLDIAVPTPTWIETDSTDLIAKWATVKPKPGWGLPEGEIDERFDRILPELCQTEMMHEDLLEQGFTFQGNMIRSLGRVMGNSAFVPEPYENFREFAVANDLRRLLFHATTYSRNAHHQLTCVFDLETGSLEVIDTLRRFFMLLETEPMVFVGTINLKEYIPDFYGDPKGLHSHLCSGIERRFARLSQREQAMAL